MSNILEFPKKKNHNLSFKEEGPDLDKFLEERNMNCTHGLLVCYDIGRKRGEVIVLKGEKEILREDVECLAFLVHNLAKQLTKLSLEMKE